MLRWLRAQTSSLIKQKVCEENAQRRKLLMNKQIVNTAAYAACVSSEMPFHQMEKLRISLQSEELVARGGMLCFAVYAMTLCCICCSFIECFGYMIRIECSQTVYIADNQSLTLDVGRAYTNQTIVVYGGYSFKTVEDIFEVPCIVMFTKKFC
uniref:Uncharacterized protein n=1 Tax=Glossina austeni TaxID=7395 RepID=A0A1A9V343_GLOAU